MLRFPGVECTFATARVSAFGWKWTKMPSPSLLQISRASPKFVVIRLSICVTGARAEFDRRKVLPSQSLEKWPDRATVRPDSEVDAVVAFSRHGRPPSEISRVVNGESHFVHSRRRQIKPSRTAVVQETVDGIACTMLHDLVKLCSVERIALTYAGLVQLLMYRLFYSRSNAKGRKPLPLTNTKASARGSSRFTKSRTWCTMGN